MVNAMSHSLILPNQDDLGMANLSVRMSLPGLPKLDLKRMISSLAQLNVFMSRIASILGWPLFDRAVVRLVAINQPTLLTQENNGQPELEQPGSGSNIVNHGSSAVGSGEMSRFSARRNNQPDLFYFSPTYKNERFGSFQFKVGMVL